MSPNSPPVSSLKTAPYRHPSKAVSAISPSVTVPASLANLQKGVGDLGKKKYKTLATVSFFFKRSLCAFLVTKPSGV